MVLLSSLSSARLVGIGIVIIVLIIVLVVVLIVVVGGSGVIVVVVVCAGASVIVATVHQLPQIRKFFFPLRFADPSGDHLSDPVAKRIGDGPSVDRGLLGLAE